MNVTRFRYPVVRADGTTSGSDHAEAADAAERVGNEASLPLQLLVIGEVLQLTAAALGVERAQCVSAIGSRLDDPTQRADSPTRLARLDANASTVPGGGSRHEDDAAVG